MSTSPTLPSLPVGAWLGAHARHRPGARCFVDGFGREYSWRDISQRVDRLAAALHAEGLQPGDRIGLLATDSVDYMVVLLASLKLGTTYVPYNYRLAAPELSTFAAAAPLQAFFVGARYEHVIPDIVERSPDLRPDRIIGFEPIAGYRTVDELVAAGEGRPPVDADTDPERIVGLMFTSGTTGRPKGVLQSMRMVRANTIAGVIDQRLVRDDFRYSASPLFHIAGMGSVLYGIALGFPSLILEQFDAPTLLHWIRVGGLTSFLAMPTMLRALLDQPGVRDQSYPHLRSVMYGGSPMTPSLLREAIDVFGCDFYNGFGAGTEAGGQTMLYPEEHRRALAGEEHLLGSIGRPMFGVELRLCDDELDDVSPGEVGEIVTRSESVMSGYLDDPQRTAESLVDGWFRAGDLAYADDEGYLYLAGRKSDMIIRGGENVYPVEIESVLSGHRALAEVAVVGQPDDFWGEIVVAVVVERDGAAVSDDELRTWCRERLAAYKVPARIQRVESFPKNVNGKVQKHLLARMLATGS